MFWSVEKSSSLANRVENPLCNYRLVTPNGGVSAPEERMKLPKILMAILAKDKAKTLDLYLRCVDAFDYPKDRIFLWVRTNNNRDTTRDILWNWLERVKDQYAGLHFDDSDSEIRVEKFEPHEWVLERFDVLCPIRQESMEATLKLGLDYYVVLDCDNYLVPCALRRIIQTGAPIIAPMLQHPLTVYSNYHSSIDAGGWFANDEWYVHILARNVRGLLEVPVIHCSYAVKSEVIPKLTYIDDSCRYDYVIFAESARKAGIPQILDNRQFYGTLSTGESPEELAAAADLFSRCS